MAILLAILLAFLAQNLATPWPYDFATVCAVLGGLLALAAARSRGVARSSWRLFAALAGVLIVGWQLLPASLAAEIFMLSAAALFVTQTRGALPAEAASFARLSPRASRAIQTGVIVIILCASAVLSIYDNAHIQPGLHGDEAESGLEARNLNAGRYSTLIGVGWYDQPLPSFLVQAMGLRLFGDDVSGLRTTSAVVSLAALPLLYWLARRLFGGRVALITLVLVAFAHWFIAYARIGINYNQTLLLELVAVLAFWEGWRSRRWTWWALCGVATGAGLYLYFASRLVPIMLGVFAVYLWVLGRASSPAPLPDEEAGVSALPPPLPAPLPITERGASEQPPRPAPLTGRALGTSELPLSPALVTKVEMGASELPLPPTPLPNTELATGELPASSTPVVSLERVARDLPIPPTPLARAASGEDDRRKGPAFRHLALWVAVTLIIFAPIGVFFVDHAKELNSRAAFVFLFSDTQFNTRAEKMQIYTGTTDVPQALLVQVERYATLFNLGGDRSGQYGNSLSLLDYYTAVFFVLGLAYALPRWREPRFGLLLLWMVLTIFIGGVLTIESPFTPRIIGVLPVPFMLAAVALEQVYVRVRAELSPPAGAGAAAGAGARGPAALARLARWAPVAAVAVLLGASMYWNYWAYFERYIHTIDGWAQREPATEIARYAAAMQPDQTLYVLSQPDLFVWHGTIRFLAPNVRGADLLDPANDLPIRDTQTGRASFVMLPNHTQWLELLRFLYPRGEYKEYRRASGELWYAIYEVDAAEIAAAR